MTSFLTVKEEYSETTVVTRSEFLTIVRHVGSEEETFAALAEIRKKYSDATHVCYAAIFDRSGYAARFSDDGEPSGTAGQPIMEALKASGLRETLVAVVRWFGGIKLGAGGLVRAYSSAASSAIKNARVVRFELCDVYELWLDFARAKKFTAAAARLPLRIIGTEYSDRVRLTLAAENGLEITAAVADAIGAKPDIDKLETRFIERPETENVR